MTSRLDCADEADDAASGQSRQEAGNEAPVVGKHISGVRPIAPSPAPLSPDFSSATRVRNTTEDGRYYVKPGPGPRDTIPDTPEALLYAEAVQLLVQAGQTATHENVSAVINSLREARNREKSGG